MELDNGMAMAAAIKSNEAKDKTSLDLMGAFIKYSPDLEVYITTRQKRSRKFFQRRKIMIEELMKPMLFYYMLYSMSRQRIPLCE